MTTATLTATEHAAPAEAARFGPRVLLVGDFPPPHGGVAVHVAELQRAIREGGGEAVVLDIGKGQLPADGVLAAGAPVRFAALLGWYAARGYLIHLHTSGANAKSWALALACAGAGRATGRPALVTLHSGLLPAWLFASPLRRALAGRIAGQFGAVIAVSAEIARALRLCGVDGRSVRIAPAFLRAQPVPGAPPPLLAELRRERCPIVCAMLAPGPVYGAETLLRAFARVHATNGRARLLLYGSGTSGSAFRALVAAACGPASEAVAGFGELPRPAALGLIAGCDVFVRPTLPDGDSVSVREALSLGRHVVATSVGNRPPGVRLVPCADAGALAAEILAALAQPAGAAAAAAGPGPFPQAPREGSGAAAEAELFALYRGAFAAAEGPPCAASAAS